MKKVLFFASVVTFTIACNAPTDIEKKKAELEQLKKEKVELSDKIIKLEGEIAAADSTADKSKGKVVGIETLTPRLFQSFIEVQGRVDADENVGISPEMGGVVTRIDVKIGDEVQKGQLLAETDNKAMMQGLAELQNALELATTLYNKQKNLWDQKIGTEVQFLSAKNQKEGLEKKMATLQQQIEMTKIKSPINGTVDAIDLKVGQMAIPGFPAIRVVNFDNMSVKAEVAESYASKIKKGNPVVIVFPDMQDTFVTQIYHSAKVINPLNRTFNIEVSLDNKREYHPNQIAVVKVIEYTNEKSIVVPVKTIQRIEEQDYIFVNENNKAKKIAVKVGRTYNGEAEVLEGLKPGDQVIVKGFQDLNEGEEVKL